MERLLQDIRYGARHLRHSPAFSLISIGTLAIGIAASTAIFTQVNAVFWKQLPVDRPDGLRSLVWTSAKPTFVLGPNVVAGPRLPVGDTYGSFSYLAYVAMRDETTSFSDLACWLDIGDRRPILMGEYGFGSVQFVSGNYFRTLGLRASLGRTIAPEDDRRGAASPVAIVSHRFWQRAFGGDSDVLTKTIPLNGHTFAIVGVLPKGFFGFDPAITPDVMVPIGTVQIAAATVNPLENPGMWIPCRVVARVKAGVSEEQARHDAELAVRDAILAHPPSAEYALPRVWFTDAGHGLATLRNAAARPLFILVSAVAGLLLITCANIAGLLLARARARQREIATRLALGASRGGLVRQLLTESVVLSLAGGLAGVALSFTFGRVTATLLAQFLPTVYGERRTLGVEIAPDARVLLCSCGLAVLTGLAFGLTPALRATRFDVMSIIKQNAAAERRFRLTAGKTMVALQTALAMLLLVGAGLFVRTVVNLRSAAMGFQPDGLLYFKMEPRTGGVPADRRSQFFADAVTQLERMPGVLSASAALRPPMASATSVGIADERIHVCTAGFVPQNPGDDLVAFNAIAPRFFETVRVPLRAGRDVNWHDWLEQGRPSDAPVAMINEAFVKRFFAEQDAIGRHVGLECPARPDRFTVVGVVADTRTLPRSEAGPTIYLPLGATTDPMTLVVRTAGAPAAMVATIRRVMADVNARVPIFGEITPLELREQQIRQERVVTDVVVAFGLVAGLLACLGIYGMLAYAVSRRTAEIGLRMALGAQRGEVIRMIVAESIVPVAVGIASGLACALMATRSIASFLFGVSSTDPPTMMAVAAMFLAIGACAAFVPARRASRIDPLVALRTD